MEKDFGFIFLSNGRFCCVMHDEYGEATLTVLQALMMAGWQAAGCLQSHSNLKILSSQFQLILLPSSARHRNHENGNCSTSSSSCGCSAVCFNPSSVAKLLVSAKHNNLPQPECKNPPLTFSWSQLQFPSLVVVMDQLLDGKCRNLSFS
jgi:hypothetical protein